MRIIRKLLGTVCPILILASVLGGCHTVEGAGQDISETGQTISGAAASTHP